MKKQSQSPAFGRKSEALNPKSETISNIKTLNSQNKSAYSAQDRNLKKQSQFIPNGSQNTSGTRPGAKFIHEKILMYPAILVRDQEKLSNGYLLYIFAIQFVPVF